MEKEDWSCDCCGKPLGMAWIVVDFHWIDGDKQKGFDDFEIQKYCPQCEIMRWTDCLPYGMNLLFVKTEES